MRVVIEGRDLPGRRFERYRDVRVALQVRREPAGPVRGDAAAARWETEVDVTAGDFRGPAVHGKPGERFLYLTWGSPADAGGEWNMFRRAKLMLADADPALVERAAAGEGALVGRISLTDDCGGPRCARVGPPALEWSVEA